MENKKQKILESLKEIVDPELGFNIVDLGMIKILDLEDSKIKVKFTPTNPLCPFVGILLQKIEEKLKENKLEPEIEIDFDWNISKVSKEIKEKLGLG